MKSQITNHKSQTISKFKIRNSKRVLNLGLWSLEFVCNLPARRSPASPAGGLGAGGDFGVWNFLSRGGAKGGYAAITMTLLVMIVSLTIIGGLSFFAFQEVKINRLFVKSVESKFISEGGIEDGVYRILTAKQITSGEMLPVGKGTTTLVLTIAGQTRTLRSEGRRENIHQNLETRIVLNTTDAQFFYGAQVGDGGLQMDNNSRVNGSVFSNGDITGREGGGTARITGAAFAAGNSEIKFMDIDSHVQAHRISTSTVAGYASSTHLLHNTIVGLDAHANTVVQSAINKDAYYMEIAISTVVGLSCDYPSPGPGCPDPYDPVPPTLGPLPLPIPDSTITQWKNDAASGDIINGDYDPTGCAPVLARPTKITGNMILDQTGCGAAGQVLTIRGTVWVVGNIDISQNASIVLDPDFSGDNSGVVISDGWIHTSQNGQFRGSGIAGSYLMMLSTLSAGGKHSHSSESNIAIDLHNNATGAIFYAQNGKIFLHQNANVTELVGYSLHLEENAILNYEIGLQNVKFPSGPSGGYDLKYWKEVE